MRTSSEQLENRLVNCKMLRMHCFHHRPLSDLSRNQPAGVIDCPQSSITVDCRPCPVHLSMCTVHTHMWWQTISISTIFARAIQSNYYYYDYGFVQFKKNTILLSPLLPRTDRRKMEMEKDMNKKKVSHIVIIALISSSNVQWQQKKGREEDKFICVALGNHCSACVCVRARVFLCRRCACEFASNAYWDWVTSATTFSNECKWNIDSRYQSNRWRLTTHDHATDIVIRIMSINESNCIDDWRTRHEYYRCETVCNIN